MLLSGKEVYDQNVELYILYALLTPARISRCRDYGGTESDMDVVSSLPQTRTQHGMLIPWRSDGVKAGAPMLGRISKKKSGCRRSTSHTREGGKGKPGCVAPGSHVLHRVSIHLSSPDDSDSINPPKHKSKKQQKVVDGENDGDEEEKEEEDEDKGITMVGGRR